MTLYIIRGETVSAHAAAPAASSEGELLVQSPEDIEASALSKSQLAAIWNALPGVASIAKFKDRKTGAQRLWAGFSQLPVNSTGVDPTRAGSKQAQVIGLLERPEGATVTEIAVATGWQPHTVRGMFSGALKKKLRLRVVSTVEERGRVYRIDAASSQL